MWSERLQGRSSRNSSWSSMMLADGRIYIPNQSGDVFVLRASPTFEVIATNSVAEPTNASLAAAGGDIFLRTDKSLWCFGGGAKPGRAGRGEGLAHPIPRPRDERMVGRFESFRRPSRQRRIHSSAQNTVLGIVPQEWS